MSFTIKPKPKKPKETRQTRPNRGKSIKYLAGRNLIQKGKNSPQEFHVGDSTVRKERVTEILCLARLLGTYKEVKKVLKRKFPKIISEVDRLSGLELQSEKAGLGKNWNPKR